VVDPIESALHLLESTSIGRSISNKLSAPNEYWRKRISDPNFDPRSLTPTQAAWYYTLPQEHRMPKKAKDLKAVSLNLKTNGAKRPQTKAPTAVRDRLASQVLTRNLAQNNRKGVRTPRPNVASPGLAAKRNPRIWSRPALDHKRRKRHEGYLGPTAEEASELRVRASVNDILAENEVSGMNIPASVGISGAPVQFLHNEPKKFQRFSSTARGMNLNSRDYLGTVSISSATLPGPGNNAIGSLLFSLNINPTQIIGEAVRRQASLWDNFRFKKMVVGFYPSSATSSTGNVVGAFNMDPTEFNPATIQSIKDAVERGGTFSNFWTPHHWSMPPAGGGRYYMDANGSTNADIRFSNEARFDMNVSVPTNTTGVVGSVWIEYDVEFSRPTLQPNFVGGCDMYFNSWLANHNITNVSTGAASTHGDTLCSWASNQASSGGDACPGGINALIPGPQPTNNAGTAFFTGVDSNGLNGYYLPPGLWDAELATTNFNILKAAGGTEFIHQWQFSKMAPGAQTGTAFSPFTASSWIYDQNSPNKVGLMARSTTSAVSMGAGSWASTLAIPADGNDYFVICQTGNNNGGADVFGVQDILIRFTRKFPSPKETSIVTNYVLSPGMQTSAIHSLEDRVKALEAGEKKDDKKVIPVFANRARHPGIWFANQLYPTENQLGRRDRRFRITCRPRNYKTMMAERQTIARGVHVDLKTATLFSEKQAMMQGSLPTSSSPSIGNWFETKESDLPVIPSADYMSVRDSFHQFGGKCRHQLKQLIEEPPGGVPIDRVTYDRKGKDIIRTFTEHWEKVYGDLSKKWSRTEHLKRTRDVIKFELTKWFLAHIPPVDVGLPHEDFEIDLGDLPLAFQEAMRAPSPPPPSVESKVRSPPPSRASSNKGSDKTPKE